MRTCKWILFALAIGASRLDAQTSALTLNAAINEALAMNDQLVNQRDDVQQSDLGLELAKSTFRPKIVPNLQGSFGQTDVSNQTYRVDVTQKFTTGTELRLGAGTATSQIPAQLGIGTGNLNFYAADTTLMVTQPLLRGFGSSVTRQPITSAELRHADAERRQTIAAQRVAVEVAAAYYRVVAQEALVVVSEQSLARSRTLYELSAAKLGAGLVSQLDVLRAEQLVTQSETQTLDARAAVEDARDGLLLLIGRDPGSVFDVVSHIPEVGQSPVDVDRVTAIALANRLDLKSQIAINSEADLQVKVARNQLLPQFDVNLALTRRQTTHTLARSFGLDGFTLATFFTISSPIDRTAQRVDYLNATIEQTRRKREITTLERQIAVDVKRAVRDRERNVRTVQAATAIVELSRKEVEVAQARYDRGLSNNLDVVTAESNLLAAESRRIQALAETAVAGLRFRAVLGILDPRLDTASLDGAGAKVGESR